MKAFLAIALALFLSGCANLTPAQRERLDGVYARLLGVAADTVIRSIEGFAK